MKETCRAWVIVPDHTKVFSLRPDVLEAGPDAVCAELERELADLLPA